MDSREARLRTCVATGNGDRAGQASAHENSRGRSGKKDSQGEMRGEFSDAPVASNAGGGRKKIICLYSSGGAAQAKSIARRVGNLTCYISEFFDTRVGAKAEGQLQEPRRDSFRLRPDQFLFISMR